MKKFLAAMMICAFAVSTVSAAGIVEDNTSYDRFWTGAWSLGGGLGGWRDDVVANGDTWLATNGGFVQKGGSEAEDYVGWYHGASADANIYVDYSFTATADIDAQDWKIKGSVNRSANRHNYVRFQVNINGAGFVTVDNSSVFGNGTVSYDIDMGDVLSGFALDGPTEQRQATGLGISAGDSVVYRFLSVQNSPDSNAKNIGLGVALVPEPATMSLLGLGGLALLRRRRR